MLKSFRNAINGILTVIKTERNFKIHLLLFLLAILLAYYFQISKRDWLMLLIASMVVFVAEAMNTAIEKLADAVTEERNERIRIAKDVAAGAVLISALFAVVVGSVVFIPYLQDSL